MSLPILKNDKSKMVIGGIFIGIISVVLVLLGNPKNMGFCIACFIRDIAGALKLHTASPVMYIRPEIIGIVLGSFAISLITKEFKVRSGSSPLTRFLISFCVMIGALLFLGCPFRMILRLAGGDLNALFGLFGFVAGIGCACIFLNKGFSLGRSYNQKTLSEGAVLPFINVLLLCLLIFVPAVLSFSAKGPGSMHAKVFYSLIFGIVVAFIAQRTRFCMAGGIRDVFLIRDYTLVLGFLSILISALILNLITGNFNLGFKGQPVAHTNQVWNFLGMFIVGFGSCLLGGCPLRQLILAGEGNTDSAMSVIGMLFGAAFSHNFKLVGNATESGPNVFGKTVGILIIVLLISYAAYNTFFENKERSEE